MGTSQSGDFDALVEALADPAAPTSVHGRKRARNVHIADSLDRPGGPGRP